MKAKWLLMILGMAPTSFAIAGSEKEAPDYPCLSNICLNAEASKHVDGVEWQVLPSSHGLHADAVEKFQVEDRVLGVSAADSEVVALRTIQESADGDFLKILSKSDATFCRDAYYGAVFVSSSGYPTYVYFKPNEKGKLRVVRMVREYPTNDPVEESGLIDALLHEFPFLGSAPLSHRRGSYITFGEESWGGTAQLGSLSAHTGVSGLR